jgi:hypothetical protein
MDAISDSSRRTLIEISRERQLPAYVLTTEIMDKEASASLDDQLFADVARRQYPLHDAGNTWLSAAYFVKDRAAVPAKVASYVEQRIRIAAKIHGIAADVEPLFAETKTATAPEDNDANYGAVIRDAAGNVIRKLYPLLDGDSVKMAMERFARERGLYPLGPRRQIAAQIVKQAEIRGIPVPNVIFREAGRGYPVKSIMMDELLERAQLVKDAEAAQLLANVNELVYATDATELLPVLDKIAEVVDAVDRFSGFHRLYGRKLLPPADFIYTMTEKEAAAMLEDSMPLGRHIFSIRKLAELDPEVFAVLGDDFPKELATSDGKTDAEKLAAILPTLPLPDKELLENHLVGLFAQ